MLILFLFLLYTVVFFFIGSFLTHFTVKIIFKIKKAKFTTALKVNFFIYLIDLAFSATLLIFYLNWDKIKSIDEIGLGLFRASFNPSNILISVIFFVAGWIVFYFLLKKYYALRPFKSIRVTAIALFLFFILFSILIILFHFFVAQPFFVKGEAMEPTLENSEYLLVKMRDKNYQRENIIVFRNPKEQHQHFVGRIIGLPNEKIQIKSGQVFLYNQEHPDGIVLNESYLPLGVKTESSNNDIIELKENEYFVLGDNRENSYDSREFGPISKNLIIAKYWFSPFKNTK